MNARRRAIVDIAFSRLDKTGDGIVTIDDLKTCYDTSQHPDVISGKSTREEVLSDFLSQWDRTKKDGIVTPDEFAECVARIPKSSDSDTCLTDATDFHLVRTGITMISLPLCLMMMSSSSSSATPGISPVATVLPQTRPTCECLRRLRTARWKLCALKMTSGWIKMTRRKLFGA